MAIFPRFALRPGTIWPCAHPRCAWVTLGRGWADRSTRRGVIPSRTRSATSPSPLFRCCSSSLAAFPLGQEMCRCRGDGLPVEGSRCRDDDLATSGDAYDASWLL